MVVSESTRCNRWRSFGNVLTEESSPVSFKNLWIAATVTPMCILIPSRMSLRPFFPNVDLRRGLVGPARQYLLGMSDCLTLSGRLAKCQSLTVQSIRTFSAGVANTVSRKLTLNLEGRICMHAV